MHANEAHHGATRRPGALHFAIVLIASYAQSTGVAWPFSFGFDKGQTVWWIQLLALAALVAVLARTTGTRRAAGLAWAYATGWLASTFWWLFIAMHTYGGLPAWLAVLAVLALAAALGMYYALALGAWHWLRPASNAAAALAFAVLWAMAEMARGTWLTGFGWGAIGYAHLEGPLALYFPWLGSYGVAAVAAGWAAAIGLALARGRWLGAVVASALVLAPQLLPAQWSDWTEPTSTLQVSLLQGNIAQDEKFQAGSGVPQALAWYRSALERSTSTLVVAPETAIALLPEQLPPSYWQWLRNRFSQGGQTALIGVPLGNLQSGYTNSVIGLTPGASAVWRYDKHHLVPFGEFIPPLFRWFTDRMHIPLGNFSRGPLGQPSLQVAGERVAANICYEDLYGEELASRFTDPTQAPTLFANVSNLGWFDDSVALYQHLNISRARALEFQRPFVRATNTGATAIVSHQGRVLDMLAPLTRGQLDGLVQGRSGITPFAAWAARYGLWPLWLSLVAALLLALWRRQPGHDAVQ